jgi:hypothetical protein
MKASNYLRLLRTVRFAAIGLFAWLSISGVYAQDPTQLLRSILNAASQGQATTAPTASPSNDMIASTPPVQAPAGSILWANKQAFLDATRSGALIEVYGASPEEKTKLAASIANILYTEFQVPPIQKNCYRFEDDVYSLLGNVAEANMATLSDRGPEFVSTSSKIRSYGNSIDSRVRELQGSSGDYCDQRLMGRNIAHPYKAALITLTREYAEATKQYVSAERDRRKAAYLQAQQAESERQQAAKASEQQRIDAEAARVRADEQRRAQKERARIGG